MSTTTARRAIAGSAVLAATALGLTACGSNGQVNDASDGLLVWSLEVQPDRVAATQAVLDDFTAETGVEVELVPVEEDQVPQLLAAAALSHEMPDVIGGASLGLVRTFDGEGYLNHDVASEVVDALGADTFTQASLDLTSQDGEQISVPSDAWAQVLVYRQDLFDAAGLDTPDTYENLLTAAEALTSDGQFGITLATDPAGNFTQQTFESIALGNNCQLVDDSGAVTLDSPECAAAIDLYDTLATEYSPAGTQTVESTRASYFSGQSAMIMWSTFLLDELAGLRDDAMPSCDECTSPTWLAENSSVIPLISGPDAADSAGSYGEITSWAVTSEASPDESAQLVEYMLSDGYVGWFSMAPEGKFPVRQGNADNPTEYIDAWGELDAGVDRKSPLGDIYDADTIATLTGAANGLARWALPQGQGQLLGPITAELPIAKVVADAAAGSIDSAEAQQEMVDAVTEIADR